MVRVPLGALDNSPIRWFSCIEQRASAVMPGLRGGKEGNVLTTIESPGFVKIASNRTEHQNFRPIKGNLSPLLLPSLIIHSDRIKNL